MWFLILWELHISLGLNIYYIFNTVYTHLALGFCDFRQYTAEGFDNFQEFDCKLGRKEPGLDEFCFLSASQGFSGTTKGARQKSFCIRKQRVTGVRAALERRHFSRTPLHFPDYHYFQSFYLLPIVFVLS